MQLRFRPVAACAVRGRGFHAARPQLVRGKTVRPCRDVVSFSSAGKDGEERETPEDARQRLAELDALLEGLTKPKMRPPPPPPPPPPDPFLDREVMRRGSVEETPEFSPAYVAFSTFGLLILTIFTNVMFNLYIKPSVDGVEQSVRVQRTPMVDPRNQQQFK